MVGYTPVSRNDQFSAYDERPDPKGPGQQGVLFRKVAPAQSNAVRYGEQPPVNKWSPTTDRATRAGAVHGIPSELFHGTAARLQPGSLIQPGKPANFDGENSNGHGKTDDVNHERVYATANMHDAYRFSRIAQETRRNNGSTSARAHVYRVEPAGPMQADSEDDDYSAGYNDTGVPDLGAYQSKQPLRVLNEVQFSEAKEAHRAYNEDELGEEPGSYEFAEKTPEQRYGW
jgi:hypothetical protein